jgi:low affinity Fe/Cu permease
VTSRPLHGSSPFFYLYWIEDNLYCIKICFLRKGTITLTRATGQINITLMNQEVKNGSKKGKVERKFQAFADRIDKIVGSPFWFAFSIFMVVVWAFSGFIIGFGDSWQLIINTTTTVMTFLMIALLHSTQQKWEDRMERLQDREASFIREIKKDTKTISMEKEKASDNAENSTPTE